MLRTASATSLPLPKIDNNPPGLQALIEMIDFGNVLGRMGELKANALAVPAGREALALLAVIRNGGGYTCSDAAQTHPRHLNQRSGRIALSAIIART
jgi:hypothetical protein